MSADERYQSLDAALESFRANPGCVQFVLDNYWDVDTLCAARRFASSAEFGECFDRVARVTWPAVVLDLGAGTGIATYAFLMRGARHVFALEPDPSPSLGRGAIARITRGMPCTILDSEGESIPLPDGSVDIVYGRQVMHHARNLGLMAQECARVLRDGGLLLVCREPVVDNAEQKERFLANHPVHHLTGSENAYALREYVGSLEAAGFTIKEAIGPWDSPINLYPSARTPADVQRLPRERLARRAGALGPILGRVPGVVSMVRLLLRHRRGPGRLYSFLAVKSHRQTAQPQRAAKYRRSIGGA
jgi:SAM-dependent methyltransferase